MKLVNLTPHAITLRAVACADTIIPPSGMVARVVTTHGGFAQYVAGVPVPIVSQDTLCRVENLPNPEEGTLFLVSGTVGMAVRGRTDVVVPGTGPSDGAIRDEKGNIVAVTCLKRV